MLPNTILNVLAVFASTALASPTWRTSSGEALVEHLKRQTSQLDFPISPDASIVYPDSSEWENATARWSSWSAPRYSIAFIPAEARDVSIAVQYMSSHNISFLAMGGGHGNTITLGRVEDAVLINMARFNDITMNCDHTITVGGGAQFGPVYEVAYRAGRELPLGSCACVGVGGATLGGGHSRLQGVYGMIADGIVSMRVVLWDGSIVEVSATKHPDLFWAMRGAGHNFGIVLDYTFRTYPQQNNGLTYNADMTFTGDSIEGIFTAINELIPDQDPALAVDVFLLTNRTSGEPITYLNLVYHGPREEGDRLTARFATNLNSTGYPIERLWLNVTMSPWDQIIHVAAGGMIDHACTEGPHYNVYTASMRQFDIPQQRELYESYVEFVAANPLAIGSLILYEIFGQRAVAEQPAELTAIGNRASKNILTILQTTYTDESIAPVADEWVRGWRDELVDPQHSGYDIQPAYVNYAHGDEPLESMYGYEPWRLERLRSLKQRYDPHGFFNHYNSFLQE
ncbi:hypothetical protein DL764_004386 [Monosporascus ibericus]|uniref:FAD-binding PCMH-type domain-containing protein n=1 Tax=Monosporascus ibericus TaxID=155417 RepID=A0A4Q4TFJ0_9PEZI|nr:hypothetical protein DL764_004386 [Monosporascus ibericus]